MRVHPKFTLHHFVSAVQRGGLRPWHNPRLPWQRLYAARDGRIYRLEVASLPNRRWLTLKQIEPWQHS